MIITRKVKREVFSADSRVMVILGNHFTFQDERSRTAFLCQLQLSYHFNID